MDVPLISYVNATQHWNAQTNEAEPLRPPHDSLPYDNKVFIKGKLFHPLRYDSSGVDGEFFPSLQFSAARAALVTNNEEPLILSMFFGAWGVV